MRAILILVAGFAIGLGAALSVDALEPAPPRTPAPVPPAAGAPGCRPAPVEQRAGQVLLAGLPGVVHDHDPLVGEITDVGVGGVLVTKDNVRNAAQVRRLVAAVRDGSARPVLVATDEEPGRVSSFGEVLGRFSSARTMTRRGDPEAVRVFARQLGVELANLGIDLDFAPVADVTDGPATGIIGDRSFSGDPDEAARFALAFTRGLWSGGVLPAPRHFPGHGRAESDPARELGVVTTPLAELRGTDLRPFRSQFRAGVRAVMMAHVIYTALDDELPASLSPHAYGLLRSMGFEGVAVTDALGAGALNRRWGFAEAAVMAVAAGADGVLAEDGRQARAMRDAIVAAVAGGELADERLSEAAGRMVALKGGDPREMTCPSAL